MTPIKITLLPSPAPTIAQQILDGELPPETGDLEVLFELWRQAEERGIQIECVRPQEGKCDVVFSHRQVAIALSREIEMRSNTTAISWRRLMLDSWLEGDRS